MSKVTRFIILDPMPGGQSTGKIKLVCCVSNMRENEGVSSLGREVGKKKRNK